MIKVDLENTYDATYVSEDFKEYSFNSPLNDEEVVELHVLITEHPDELLPGVFNLAFGPIGNDGGIDDTIKVKHQNVGMVFSTILLFAISFLQENMEKKFSIGIDGSNDLRANLYHRMFRHNEDQLGDIISTVGVDWYVRLLRNGDIEIDNNGAPFFKPRPEPFDLNRKSNDLYRYYMFSLTD